MKQEKYITRSGLTLFKETHISTGITKYYVNEKVVVYWSLTVSENTEELIITYL